MQHTESFGDGLETGTRSLPRRNMHAHGRLGIHPFTGLCFTMRKGLLLAAGCYTLWGLFPVYFHLLHEVPPEQVLMHRMLWSLLLLGSVLTIRGQWGWLRDLLGSPRVIGGFAASAGLLAANWFIYIWAVNHGHVVDSSLGYFMTPLVNILLGALVLKEQLRRSQWLAIGMAALGVLWLTFLSHGFPWIGLSLAITFGTYGLLRKTAALGALEGLSLETLLLFPLAAGYLAYLHLTGQNTFATAPVRLQLWLAAAGPITAIPLIMFAAGARRIPLSLLGLMQYIAPTLQLLLGVLLYQEPFAAERAIGFAFIWTALAVYSAEGLMRYWQSLAPTRASAQDSQEASC